MKKNLNNKGISYIEFILVLAIIVILTGLVTVTMGVVNRNNVTKAADKITTGINHCKTLSLSKGSKKGSITFAKNGNQYYYYYGGDESNKYSICYSPCSMYATILGVNYAINDGQRLRFTISQSTGAFLTAERSLDGGNTFTAIAGDTASFNAANRIIVTNNRGKKAVIDLNIHVGTVKVSVKND